MSSSQPHARQSRQPSPTSSGIPKCQCSVRERDWKALEPVGCPHPQRPSGHSLRARGVSTRSPKLRANSRREKHLYAGASERVTSDTHTIHCSRVLSTQIPQKRLSCYLRGLSRSLVTSARREGPASPKGVRRRKVHHLGRK